MKKFFRRVVMLATIAAIATGAIFGSGPAMEYWRKRNRPQFRTTSVSTGDIRAVVNSTGTVKPVLQVTVGSFVSGPIEELYVEFNQQVEEGEVLAKIDPRIYEASVARDKAVLATSQAEIERISADLQRAVNDEARARELLDENAGYLSKSELDQIHFNRMSLEAQLKIAEASVQQAEASLETSQTNLEYCSIRAPVTGTVIDRKIDPGQTLAAQFQTPELFVIAPDMKEKMHVFASVDEADIGLIKAAKVEKKKVYFTVDAYRDELFEGEIWQIRQSSTVVQNVVTYPVVVEASNEDLKLMPGMTANLTFETESKADVVRIPNAALRFYPDREHVHPDDRSILDGGDDDEEADNAVEDLPADELAKIGEQEELRHVWYEQDGMLRAIEVRTGISDYRFTELIEGSLTDDQKLVVGIKPKE